MSRGAQRGASLALVILALALVVAALLALRSMTRTTDRDNDRNATHARIALAEAALQQYAASYRRLPCPADPTQSTGLEVPNVLGVCANLVNLGTLPWASLGLRSDEAVDAWGVKLSYAVFNTGLGPPTVPGGVDMTNCDPSKSGPVQLLPLPAASFGLCNPDRSTGAANFLAGKGLRIREPGKPDVTDAAYAIISHGPTGMGGFLVNNTQRALPASIEEITNALPGTSFWVLPWSGSDVEANDDRHYDDIVAHVSLNDLIARIGLGPRVWAIAGEVPDTRVTFNAETIGAALNRPVAPGDLGVNVLTIAGVASGVVGGGNLGLGTLTLADGAQAQGIGIAGGGNAILSSTAAGVTNGNFGFQFGQPVRFVGVALAGFGRNGLFAEQVQFLFFDAALNPLGTPVTKSACLLTGDFTTLSVQAPVSFSAVQIKPLPARDPLGQPGATAFLVSQVIACDATASSCYPPMATAPLAVPSNRC